MLRGNLKLYFNVLTFLAILPAVLLVIWSLTSKTHYEILIAAVVGICALTLSSFGVERLILSRIKGLISLSNRLSAGDLSARSGQTDLEGPLGELTQAFDRMAASMESQAKQIQTRADQVAVLSELASDYAIEHDFHTLLERGLDRILSVPGTSQAALALFDPASNDLVVTAGKGLYIPIGMRIKIGEGPAGRAAQNRKLVVIEKLATWQERPSYLWNYPDLTMIQLPMLYSGNLIGVLGVVGSIPSHQITRDEMHLLNLFAELAASAIKNNRLFEEMHRRLQMMETINEISISLRTAEKVDSLLQILIQKTSSRLNATMGSIWLFDPVANSLRKAVSTGIPLEKGVSGFDEDIVQKVFAAGQPYYRQNESRNAFNDLSKPSSILPVNGAFIPIRTTHAVVGVLALGFHEPDGLSEDQKHLMTTIAEMAGNAIHRMQLYDQTASQVKRLSALRQIDLAITSSLDLRYTLDILLEQVISQLGVDAACALTYNPHKQLLEFAASRGFTTGALHNTHLYIGQGYAGQAARDQRTVFIPDLRVHPTDLLRSLSFSMEGFIAYYAVPLIVRSQIKGVLEVFHRSRLENDREWLFFLDALASQAAIAIENASLYNEAQQSNIELNLAYDSTLEGWSRALDLRDEDTEGHTQRVTEIAIKLAKRIGIDDEDLVHFRWGALLHDIGKLGVPDSILLKPGSLTDEEWAIMRRHPIYAYKLLSPIVYLRPAIDIPYCHHEKWDGSGYPHGLTGEEIPLAARIFAVVDVWDALTSDRPYRKKWTEAEARAYIQEQAGKHFDPNLVEVFFELIKNDEKE